jgi:spermidine synthase
VIPWEKLGAARAPDGTELSLWRRGAEHVLRAGSIDLMSSRTHASEDALGARGAAGLGASATVLVGGLGMGFTLRAALDVLGPGARVTVAELVPEVVGWVRGPLAELARRPLDDPRVRVDVRDVAEVLAGSERGWDAILLDVDNGPRPAAQGDNARLYAGRGLATAARALRPGGRLAVWSAGDDPAFAARLAAAGLEVETLRVRAHRGPGGGASGARQAIFVGTRRS